MIPMLIVIAITLMIHEQKEAEREERRIEREEDRRSEAEPYDPLLD
jgi:hypothetical protein